MKQCWNMQAPRYGAEAAGSAGNLRKPGRDGRHTEQRVPVSFAGGADHVPWGFYVQAAVVR